MSKWLITTNQPQVEGKKEIYIPASKVHEFAGDAPTEAEINKIIGYRGAVLFMQRLAD